MSGLKTSLVNCVLMVANHSTDGDGQRLSLHQENLSFVCHPMIGNTRNPHARIKTPRTLPTQLFKAFISKINNNKYINIAGQITLTDLSSKLADYLLATRVSVNDINR